MDMFKIEKFEVKKDNRLSTTDRILFNIMLTMDEIKEELKAQNLRNTKNVNESINKVANEKNTKSVKKKKTQILAK